MAFITTKTKLIISNQPEFLTKQREKKWQEARYATWEQSVKTGIRAFFLFSLHALFYFQTSYTTRTFTNVMGVGFSASLCMIFFSLGIACVGSICFQQYCFPPEKCDFIRRAVENSTRRSQPVPVELKICAAVRFYASGSFECSRCIKNGLWHCWSPTEYDSSNLEFNYSYARVNLIGLLVLIDNFSGPVKLGDATCRWIRLRHILRRLLFFHVKLCLKTN